MQKTVVREKETALPLARLLKIFQIISFLKAGRWNTQQLMERFDISKSALYRYLELIEEAGICLEKDFHNRYFIVTTEDAPEQSQFTVEEMNMLRSLLLANPTHPLNSIILKKLSLNSELDNMPRIFLKAHLGELVERLASAIRNKRQVVLKKYHSASSNKIDDRIIEPIHFGDNYASIFALDLKDKACKQFKLDRIAEVKETRKTFEHANLHRKKTLDIFGLGGESIYWVTLRLSLRAYLLMREEYPLSIPCLKLTKKGYRFHGPVASFKGIGRFVLGLIDEIEIIEPDEFKLYVSKKILNRPAS